MRQLLRHQLIPHLWEQHRANSKQVQLIEQALQLNSNLILDHFAIIDLPSSHSGIPILKRLLNDIGYKERGKGYLADKQNDFCWLAEENCETLTAKEILPQIVIADFRLEELPHEVRVIIEKYAAKASPPPFEYSLETLSQYFNGRDWPLPTCKEFHTVHEFNELLSWVLVFGRKPNHFTLSVHLLDHFADLTDFHQFISQKTALTLNSQGGSIIKGNKEIGIAQGATQGAIERISLADGDIEIATEFVEFVWRYPLTPKPFLWKDYFTHFIPQHADRVIESLYV